MLHLDLLGILNDRDLDLENYFSVNLQQPEEQPHKNKPELPMAIPQQPIMTNVNEGIVNNDKELIVHDRSDVLAFIKSKQQINTQHEEKRDENKVSTWMAAVKGDHYI